MSQQTLEAVLEQLTDIRNIVSQNGVVPRWLSLDDARKYAGGRSKNWMLEKLHSGEIYGYQEKGDKMTTGKWIVDRNSIDDFYSLQSKSTNSKYLELKRRTGI